MNHTWRAGGHLGLLVRKGGAEPEDAGEKVQVSSTVDVCRGDKMNTNQRRLISIGLEDEAVLKGGDCK